MKQNVSRLRMGVRLVRKNKKIRRLHSIDDLRNKGMTWEDIGKRYSITKQGVFKFYKENSYLFKHTIFKTARH